MLVKKKSGVKYWIKIGALVVLILFVVGGAIYIFGYSSLFRVKNIEVNVSNAPNGSMLTAADILNGRQYTNILAPFPSIDMADFPYISSFTVTKNYLSRTISIKAVARQQAFIWCMTISGNCYWTDNTGFVFSTAPQISGGDQEVVEDSTGRNINIGQYVLPEDQFKYFMEDMNVINGLNIPVSSINIANVSYEEMTVVTSDGPQIYFGFTFDPIVSGDDTVLKNLMQSPDWSKYCYVDLRTIYKAYTSLTCI